MTKQRVTLYIPSDLWRQFRARCVQRGTSASKVVSRLIQEWLEADRVTGEAAGGGEGAQENDNPAS